MTVTGVVSQLSRYHVKSMLGEVVDELEIAATGVAGDRLCALIDRATGKVASAKLPHRWRDMLAFKARLTTSPDRSGRPLIELEAHDGARLRSDRVDLDDLLSAAPGRAVTLAFSRSADLEIERARPDEVAEHGVATQASHDTLTLGLGAPAGGFADYASVHFIASASLHHLAEAIGASASKAIRFRPNIVFETNSTLPFQENEWVGKTLRIGEAVTLRVISPTPRCAVPTLQHGKVAEHTGLTRAIGQMNRVDALDLGPSGCLGAYAQVLQCGLSRIGDLVVQMED